MPKTVTSLITLTHTAADDNPFRLTDAPIPFYEINIHVETNDCYYGTQRTQGAIGATGSVISFQNGDIRDIVFKNKTAGSNTKITIVATVPTEYTQQGLFER
jgi:hypothetical protein